ncbi:MAG: hypothetical protein KIT79_12695 [Deltaproteobacteria bacterium]|nr:hypothetical protein [Deltaproteobacteria bacterium]
MTPEEEQRIRDEERVRIEEQKAAKQAELEAQGRKLGKGCLGIIVLGVLIGVVLAMCGPEAPGGLTREQATENILASKQGTETFREILDVYAVTSGWREIDRNTVPGVSVTGSKPVWIHFVKVEHNGTESVFWWDYDPAEKTVRGRDELSSAIVRLAHAK